MKEFSPMYLVNSAYNAAAQEVARGMVLAQYGPGKKFKGGKMNHEMNLLVRDGKAVPTRERFTYHFKRLCYLHGVAFEGGIDSFLDGAWNMAGGQN